MIRCLVGQQWRQFASERVRGSADYPVQDASSISHTPYTSADVTDSSKKKVRKHSSADMRKICWVTRISGLRHAREDVAQDNLITSA